MTEALIPVYAMIVIASLVNLNNGAASNYWNSNLYIFFTGHLRCNFYNFQNRTLYLFETLTILFNSKP